MYVYKCKCKYKCQRKCRSVSVSVSVKCGELRGLSSELGPALTPTQVWKQRAGVFAFTAVACVSILAIPKEMKLLWRQIPSPTLIGHSCQSGNLTRLEAAQVYLL